MKHISLNLGDRTATRFSLHDLTSPHPRGDFLLGEKVTLQDDGWSVIATIHEDGVMPDWSTLQKLWKWRPQNMRDRTQLRQLDECSIEFLWDRDYYDGPLSGTAKFENQICWFDFNGTDAEGRHFFYILYPLTQDYQNEIETQKEDPHWTGPDLSEVKPIGWFVDGGNQSFYAVQIEYPEKRS